MPRLGWLSAPKNQEQIKGKNMQLSEKQIREFQALHKKVFGKVISKQQAMADGAALIRLVSLTQPRRES